jgi:hypothetical protein
MAPHRCDVEEVKKVTLGIVKIAKNTRIAVLGLATDHPDLTPVNCRRRPNMR